jgi:hypothetical protein
MILTSVTFYRILLEIKLKSIRLTRRRSQMAGDARGPFNVDGEDGEDGGRRSRAATESPLGRPSAGRACWLCLLG